MYILEVSYGCPSKKYPSNGNFQLDQAKALESYGHRVVFAAVDMRSLRRPRRLGLYRHSVGDIPVYEYNFPMGSFADILRRKIAAHGFGCLLKRILCEEGRPDIVHVHFADTAASIVETCRREKIPYVVTEHASSIMDDKKAANQAKMMRYVYENAASVIAVSQALAAQIEKFTGVKAVVVDNIVDTKVFRLESQKGKIGYFRFISAGNVEYRKGFDVLVSAFARVCEKYPNCSLLIMGDGAELENIKRQAAGLTDKVEFSGSFIREEFAHELNRSNCFVLASRHETFGVVYAEAMACGVPVIATRCGGTEGFVNGSNGLMVGVDDVDGLERAMKCMHDHATDFDRKEIAATAERRFSPYAVAESITKILDRALDCWEAT